ncbi:uncharacterized protein RAG0_04039 [Rhynchosporium agropyri]|uniref:Uncharacterized protein n=1 Tax=Rhynchosporium agropyri TaxID=914238 RepID=A0A1E1KBF0_9HELO|nr:uncharacterized protein RAG0_04039 [Rhynchosporium agropyri]
MGSVADGTPPERQILFPLTPLATAEWLSASNLLSLVSAALDLIEQRKRYKLTKSRKLMVRPAYYAILLSELEELPELKSFVDDKLRSGTTYITYADTNPREFLGTAQISSVRSVNIQLREFDSDDEIEIDYPYI